MSVSDHRQREVAVVAGASKAMHRDGRQRERRGEVGLPRPRPLPERDRVGLADHCTLRLTLCLPPATSIRNASGFVITMLVAIAAALEVPPEAFDVEL